MVGLQSILSNTKFINFLALLEFGDLPADLFIYPPTSGHFRNRLAKKDFATRKFKRHLKDFVWIDIKIIFYLAVTKKAGHT